MALVEKCVVHPRARVQKSLLQLLHDHDYEDISIEMITEKAGYSRTAFYRNYRNKDDCLRAIVDSEVDRNIQCLQETVESLRFRGLPSTRVFYRYYLHVFQNVYDSKEFYTLLLTRLGPARLGYFEKRFHDELVSLLSPGCQQPGIRHGNMVDYDLYAHSFAMVFLGYIIYCVSKDFTVSIEYLAKQAVLSQRATIGLLKLDEVG